ncbi:hypothetical protein [Oricola sp.]|uniref:hypothetical protein n=1 Tax=Oricola sp. TaxID=1979950 RepID=UPI003BA91A68
MSIIQVAPLPVGSFLGPYAQDAANYVDCYRTTVPGHIDLARFVATFFDSWIFRLERRLLAAFGQTGTSQGDVQALADGRSGGFAGWRVERRSDTQLLMSVRHDTIRTWLCIEPHPGDASRTDLYFGSAVVAVAAGPHGTKRRRRLATLLIPVHRLYSRILLRAAARA